MTIIKYLAIVFFAQILRPYWMEISIITASIIISLIIHHLLKSKEEREEGMEQDENSETKRHARETPDTLGLMFRTLNKLGCQPTNNGDGTLSVWYQGEHFYMDFGGRYARIWNLMWARIYADDPDLPKIREAVNAANFNFGPTVVLTEPDHTGVIIFHSRWDIMLHPACPDNKLFVKAVLDSFFDAKEFVQRNFQQIKTVQTEEHSVRRPIGFTTNNQ